MQERKTSKTAKPYKREEMGHFRKMTAEEIEANKSRAERFVQRFISAVEGNDGVLFESDVRALYKEAKNV